MPTNTYVALDKITITTATPSVTFTNIDQTYTDLVVVANLKASVAANAYIRAGNGSIDTTSGNYGYVALSGDGTTTANSQSASNSLIIATTTGGSLNNQWGTLTFRVKNYTNTNMHKVIMSRFASAAVETVMSYGAWKSTSAINQLQVTSLSPNYDVGSTFTLYGIKATATGTGTAKATGGTISYDSFGYVYHTFTTSGTFSFTPSAALSCDYLVVGGGGGGGARFGGAGGAGGLRSTLQASGGNSGLETPLVLASGTAYTVTVGAGGAGVSSAGGNGTQGSNSVFSSITSIGGGYGGTAGAEGGAGGSGGGGGGAGVPAVIGGAATSLQGNRGGTGGTTPDNLYYRAGGGGGGAGVFGTSAINGTSYGVGGAGLLLPAWSTVTSTGSSSYYAGGGGGGIYGGGSAPGGAGGGGAGSTAATGGAGGAGTANTGSGGGGGGGDASAGGNGGSGIVIIRYYGL